MKKILTICLLMAATFIVNAQKTFSSKKEAIEFLKETFETNFVKTAVIGRYDGIDGKIFNKYNYYFDYEFHDKFLVIFHKSDGDESTYYQNTSWEKFRYEAIRDITLLKKSTAYKNLIGVKFTSIYDGEFSYGVGRASGTIRTRGTNSNGSFPFNNANNIEIMGSIRNAIKAIATENKIAIDAAIETDKIAYETEKIAIKTKKIAIETMTSNAAIELKKQKSLFKESYSVLPNYKVYTEDGIQKSLPDYIEKNRRFKDKPSLVMTWGYWCSPCIKRIDEILKADLAKKYNIFLINRDLESQLSTEVFKLKWSKNSQSYTSDATVLFDRNAEFAPLDNNSAPVFIWLDKNLKMVNLYKSYAITVDLIGETLLDVENTTILEANKLIAEFMEINDGE